MTPNLFLPSDFVSGHKIQHRRIDAEALASAGGVVEDVSEMGAAFFGQDLYALHAEAVILPLDRRARYRPVKTQPA